VPQVTAQPIEGSHGDEIEASTTRFRHHRVEAGTFLPRPADGVIGELREDHPAGTGGVFSESTKLVLGGLIVGADATVQRDA
jgi:hypothetical protein